MAGHGYPVTFFVPVNGTEGTNERFAWRFFPPAIARTPFGAALAPKQPGVYRVFVLGESAAMGVPEPAFGLPRMLEAALRARYPDRPLEVVNAAMTAIDSGVIAGIARECAARAPDLFVLYIGNNEVVGPHGLTEHPTLARLAFAAKSFRLGQLLAPSRQPGEWRGMRMFLDRQVPFDDPRLPAVYRNFRENLTRICRLGRDAGAAVMLSTVAVNLRGQPPFAWDGGNVDAPPGGGCEAYRELAARHPRNADVQYRAGVACGDDALLERARDLDTLRFRADSRINDTIREVARAVPGVVLADAARQTFDFYEHVHLTPGGNRRLAAFLADHVRKGNGEAGDAGLTNWDRRRMAADIRAMTSQPPFRSAVVSPDLDLPVDRAQALETCGPPALRLRCIELLRESGRFDEAIAQYRMQLSQAGDWASWRAGLGSILTEAGRHEEAAKEFDAALRANQQLAAAHFGRGASLARRSLWSESAAAYRTALDIQPGWREAQVNLAAAHDAMGRRAAADGRVEEAIGHLRETARLHPEAAEAHYNLGALLSRAGRLPEAIAAYREALRQNEAYAEAHNNLGTALARLGKRQEAADQFRRALEIRPDYSEARRNLDLALR